VWRIKSGEWRLKFAAIAVCVWVGARVAIRDESDLVRVPPNVLKFPWRVGTPSVSAE